MSQRISLDAVRHPVKKEGEVHQSVWKRFVAVDHNTRLFTLQYFSHLHALHDNNSLYTLSDDKRLEWSVVKQLQSTTPGLPFCFASLFDEVVQPLLIKTPAWELPNVIELDDEGNA